MARIKNLSLDAPYGRHHERSSCEKLNMNF